jgi:hypothetical protein
VSQLRIVEGDVVELDGVPIAHLRPNLTLSLRDELICALDAADEDYVAGLEDRVEQLEAWLRQQGPKL